MSRINATLSAAVMMALSAASSLGHAARMILPSMPKSFQGEITLAPMTYGHRGAGISMAQQKRAATKKRNKVRHKSRC